MEHSKTVKEFVENIKSINLLNSKIESEDKKLILAIKIKGDSINNIICEFKILEKDRVWVKSFKYEDFIEYKNKMGFDGSWKSFFKTLDLAVNKTEGGDMSIKFPTNSYFNTKSGIKKNILINKINEKDKEKSQNLILTIFHPLSEDLKVKSDIIFEQFHLCGSDEYRNLNFDIALELHESKEFNLNKEKEKAHEFLKNVTSNSNNHNGLYKGIENEVSNNENRGAPKLELKKNMKRKFNSDLINPNIKKRRGKGVKFVEDNEQNDETSINNLI